jgi:hypothetical protein
MKVNKNANSVTIMKILVTKTQPQNIKIKLFIPLMFIFTIIITKEKFIQGIDGITITSNQNK